MNRRVKLTKENELEVLDILEKLGFVWVSGGEKPTKWLPSRYEAIRGEKYISIYEDMEILNASDTTLEIIELDELKSCLLTNEKLVRKLKDLNGLKNDKGWELLFENDDNFKGKGYYQEWITLDDKSNKGWFTAFYELNQEVVNKLKQDGFNIKFMSRKTKEEILDEIEKLSDVSKTDGEFNYWIRLDYHDCKYYFGKHNLVENTFPKKRGLNRADAERLCQELNEL